MANPPRCSRCRKPFTQTFYQAEKLRFHPSCFTCDHCLKQLGERFQLAEGQIFHAACYRQKYKLVCGHCQQLLGETWVTQEGKKYHQHCYDAHYQIYCDQCGGALTTTYSRDDSGNYHTACFETYKLPPCDACGLPLKGKYLLHIWGHKAHREHPQCHVCNRIISEKTSHGGAQYGDGRVVCGICRITEITDNQQIEHAKAKVIEQLQAVGFDYIPHYLAVSLADQRTMSQRLGVKQSANSHGYTKTLEKQIPGQGRIQEHSIFILYGLPRLVFHGILAHELLHVWLNARKINQWQDKEIEGFCNLGTALIYQNEGTPLAEVLLKKMAEDPNPVYGDGYRKMKDKLNKKTGKVDKVLSKTNVLKGYGVQIINEYEDKPMADYNIQYEYYIKQANEILRKLEPEQMTLF